MKQIMVAHNGVRFEVVMVLTKYRNDEVLQRKETVTYRYKHRSSAVRRLRKITEELKNAPHRVIEVKGNPYKITTSVELRHMQ
ncbi:hypothetical protein [Escherichia coli]|uniref:hypothetical protein n=1 Tax=Escherichia coli TaxID=562 RepID=UPI000C1C49CC|nr:hypothetical protein [Escherichia coli]